MIKRKPFIGADLRQILNYYPITMKRAFEVACVHRTTWKRWLSGKSNPPAPVVELIRIHALGELTDPAFAGWRVVNGLIVDDAGGEHTAADIRTLWIYKRHSAELLSLLENCTIQPRLL